MTEPRTVELPGARTRLMGVLNVTPDSFSDGGRFTDLAAAVQQAERLAADGADILDIGGESTRPGAAKIDRAEEQARVLPVLQALQPLRAAGTRLSIDTMWAVTAEAALAAGVDSVNDVSGGLADPAILRVVADSEASYILSHWRGHSAEMNSLAVYSDPAREVRAEMERQLAAALAAGIPAERIILDPGLGFAKDANHNWAILAGLDELRSLGFPLLIGASRKRFLSDFTAPGAPATDRDAATAHLTALLAGQVWGLRVHDVAGSAQALRLAEAFRTGTAPGTEADRNAPAPPIVPRDRIVLRGLRARGWHGVYEFETEQGQAFVVDLDVVTDLAAAAGSDDVADTIHYGELADAVVARIASEPVALIETLAESIAELVLADDRATAVTVTVHKPEAPIAHPFDDVAVTIHRQRPPVRAVIALGSNLGDRAASLEAALAELATDPAVRLVQRNEYWYESPAVKPDGVDLDAPPYLNGVAIVETTLSAPALLRRLHAIEQAHGRVRLERWGDRTLDLDLIAFGDLTIDTPGLTVPHPRAQERAFVLLPWLELDPEAVLPGVGAVAELLGHVDDAIWPEVAS